MGVMRLGFVHLRVTDLEEARNHYSNTLGMTVVDQTVESTHLKRYATLDEQAAPILFLASDEASYIVGSTLPVGGGDLG